MHQLWRALLITIVLIFITSYSSFGQFSYKVKRANLTINYSAESGWKLTNQAGTKTYLEFNDENAYIQIIDNKLLVYKISSGLWNSHPDSKLMDKIHIHHVTIPILANDNVFDFFSSLWISSSGGHIRIFRYAESIHHELIDGGSNNYQNQYIGNSIFLNRDKRAKIHSENTIFMISPSQDVFEINPSIKTWRLILKNRTLTPWSSDAPKEKFLFNVFKKEDFKKIIPLGSKNNKFYFQIINHQNKMGLAYLTKDYFQIVIEIPPLFDFISPSIQSDYHLIKNNEKLGVLYFLPKHNKNDVREFKSFFTPAKTQLLAQVSPQKNGPLLSDGNIFNVTKNGVNKTSNDFTSTINFGIKLIHYDLILYTEYNANKKISHSGLYKISQSQWYIKPEKNLLVNYPSSILEVNHTLNNDFLYSCYSSNGYLQVQNVSSIKSHRFSKLTALILDTQVDTIISIPEFDSFTYKYKSVEKWGLLRIKNENFKLITSAKYDWIQPYGNKKSLLIINDHKFGWYGVDYSNSDSTPFIIEPKTIRLSISHDNNIELQKNQISSSSSLHKVEYSNNHYIFNTVTNEGSKTNYSAWIQTSFNSTPIQTASKIESVQGYFNVTTIRNNMESMAIINHKLKPIAQPKYDSISILENHLLLFDTSKSTNFTLKSGEQTQRHQLVSAFYLGKPIKVLSKYEKVYYFKSYFIAKKENLWIVLGKGGKPTHKLPFKSIVEALTFTNALIKIDARAK